MFSAPGCKGSPNHAFSHPFVQVMISISPRDNNTPFTSKVPLSTSKKQRTESVIYVKWELVLAPCSSLHITFPHLCYFSCMHLNKKIKDSFLHHTSPHLTLPGCGNVFGRVVLSGGVPHSPLLWSAQTWAHDGSGPKFQPSTFPPPCPLWHVGNIHHVCWWVSNMWRMLCQQSLVLKGKVHWFTTRLVTALCIDNFQFIIAETSIICILGLT